MPALPDAEALASWRRDGYLVWPRFAAPGAVAALRQRALAIVDAYVPDEKAAVFSSRDRDRARLGEAALIESASQVRCFFEEEALDPDGRLVVDKARAINKIGHALHDRDPVFDRFSRDARLAALAAELGVVEPLLMQSMLIFKQPRIGGEVVWHQDASFLATKPQTVVGFWFALEDATRDNGCLWVAPGGHRGPLRERYGRGADGALTMERLDDTPWPSGKATVPLEVEAGTMVVFDGLLPHASAPNRSERSRMAYTLHVVDGRAAWWPGNWLQRDQDDPPRGFGYER
ncbi:MAG: phytanoyl-CoA dioxygenase family protein [Aquincola sp.]|nr:phytanoyl-CoA dioxygenase family protein [Aquincola sp.]MDH4289942.1 phytanoyl-CoA dioxygenase family protein [Aquincola sp.]